MAVTYAAPIRADVLAFVCGFTSDRATPVSFRCFLNGQLIQKMESSDGYGEVLIPGDIANAPLLEVLDHDDLVPHFAVDGRATLQWSADPTCVDYLIEEYVASVWTERDRVPECGVAHYQWRTRFLEDSTTHQFRVTPRLYGGVAGTPLAYSFAMVRVPDAPNVAVSWAAGAFTIEAA